MRNCCKKGSPGDAYLCWVCVLCQQVGAPPTVALWHQSVFGNTCFAQRWGRDRRGEGWGRQTVFAHAEIVGFSSFLLHREEVDPENLSAWLQPSSHVWMRVQWPCGCAARLPSSPPPYLYEGATAFVHPWEGLTALCAACSGGRYQLIPVIMGVLQTNSWKPIKATYYVITSPLSPETPL